MSNYRRLISYIYAYEGGIKGKNIGFAKIETRGSQCKITVNVKKVYVGGNDIGVYLLAGEKEILLGNIFIRGGSGEFRTVVSVSDVEHSGIPMDQCYGLTVHDVENTWRSYTTIWEDAVAHAAEVELSNTLPETKEREETAQEAQIKKARDFADGEEIHIYIDPSDKSKQNLLSLHTGCDVRVSEYSFLGGTRAVIASKNILIDNSFETRLKEAEEGFQFVLGGN